MLTTNVARSTLFFISGAARGQRRILNV